MSKETSKLVLVKVHHSDSSDTDISEIVFHNAAGKSSDTTKPHKTVAVFNSGPTFHPNNELPHLCQWDWCCVSNIPPSSMYVKLRIGLL